jgi:Arc/MetJ family transcription regulator
MRTNIIIDDRLMNEAMRLTGITTKREVVEKALQVLVRNAGQSAVLALEGKIHWGEDLYQMRQPRYLHLNEEPAEYRAEPSTEPTATAPKTKRRKPVYAADNARHG